MFLRLAGGAKLVQIARSTSLSVKTVSTYRTRVMVKMNLRSNGDLTYCAMKNNLLQ